MENPKPVLQQDSRYLESKRPEKDSIADQYEEILFMVLGIKRADLPASSKEPDLGNRGVFFVHPLIDDTSFEEEEVL